MSEVTFMLKWELFKYECQRFAIQFAKQHTKDQNKTYDDNMKDLTDILNIPFPSNEDKEKLHSLRGKFDLFFQTKAKGAFRGSRARWLEHGERNSSFFFNLEKNVTALYIDCKNETAIFSFISNFYQKLYTSSFDPHACCVFFDKVKSFIPKVS